MDQSLHLLASVHPELKPSIEQFCSTHTLDNDDASSSSLQTAAHQQPLVELLAPFFIDPRYTLSIVHHFASILPRVISYTVDNVQWIATARAEAHQKQSNEHSTKKYHSDHVQQVQDMVTHALSLCLTAYNKSIVVQFLSRHMENKPPLPDKILALSKQDHKRSECLQLLRIAFRLLQHASQEFSWRWNWSPFFSLLQSPDKHIQWYALRCISILLDLGDTQHPFSERETFRTMLEELERDHLYNVFALHAHEVSAQSFEKHPQEEAVYDGDDMINVFGVWIHKKRRTKVTGSSDDPGDGTDTSVINRSRSLIYTPTTIQNLRSIALSVSQSGNPILLEGITGVGKTALVEHLAILTNNSDLIKVNLDESFDSKDLLGTYVCTDVPGEFRWQQGALSKAVTEGRWILIEDIDLAPFDVISALIPLIESGKLFLPSRDEVIPATPGFQLFATQSLFESSTGAPTRQRSLPMINLWTRVLVEKLPTEEINTVLQEKYANIKHLIPKFIETFEVLRGTHRKQQQQQQSTNDSNQMMLDDTVDDIDSGDDNGSMQLHAIRQLGQFGRFFSFRDLLKWCERVQRLYAKNLTKREYILSEIKEDIFREAVDIFCGMISKKKLYDAVVRQLAFVWQISTERLKHLETQHKPRVVDSPGNVTVGRVSLQLTNRRNDSSSDDSNGHSPTTSSILSKRKSNFAYTKQSLRLLEQIAVCVKMNEPVLLTGETGTGKTSIVQYLANLMGRKLVVHNLNQQTDSSDFIGGYKPVDLRVLAASLRNHFEKLFSATFSVKQNEGLMGKVKQQFSKRNWKGLVLLFERVIEKAILKCSPKDTEDSKQLDSSSSRSDETPSKRQKKGKSSSATRNQRLLGFWRKFEEAVKKFDHQQQLVQNSFAFSFVEGSLVKSIKEGHWILLDEINLASTETLERLSSLLEGEDGTIYITEKGDTEPVKRHPNFRLFSCMNPPTDIGKKDLPPSLRNRFTEFYVRELVDHDDLKIVVNQYLQRHVAHPPTDDIVDFYLESRRLSEGSLSDGANQRPHYSLRTLSRALEYVALVLPVYGLERALYEGFSMGFLTQLSTESYPTMQNLIKKHFLKKLNEKQLSKVPSRPDDDHVQFEHFWLKVGPEPLEDPPNFIITPSVSEHLKNLARVVMTQKYPILLQGPTSSGKTSMVSYLAKRTGHRFVRINNHESTDLQEYFGTYITNAEGKLVFQEGILVEAVRNGYWIVLDELNLAPSDILEALNRLLDDNRELFIPETQETIKPHPHFQLFATQNPPGLYGGRKVLSRAFRNRFQELHIADIPGNELEEILQKRCSIPRSFARRLVAVMTDLQTLRQGSKVFAGKGGFITPRDLFRWAERQPSSYKELAEQGYILLAERLRKDDEKEIVKKVLEKHMKTKLDIDAMYEAYSTMEEFHTLQERLKSDGDKSEVFSNIVWTKSMKRLFVLVAMCLRFKEPVLLVGETGCGKTTIFQLFSYIMGQQMHILNCHQHTETSDFLGSLRPVRGRDRILANMHNMMQRLIEEARTLAAEAEVDDSINFTDILGNTSIPSLSECNEDNAMISSIAKSLDKAAKRINKMRGSLVEEQEEQGLRGKDSKRRKIDSDNSLPDESSVTYGARFLELYDEFKELYSDWKALFVWYDGPLIQSMRNGNLFLIDEISLAEDAVLERLNSVLEPSRMLTLPEKGSEKMDEIVANEKFRVMATMNPGGDFGKKELSPALRNRFTEFYVPSLSVSEDLAVIISMRLHPSVGEEFTAAMVEFVEKFKGHKSSKRILSIRDVISWIEFIGMAIEKLSMDRYEAYLHGAETVIVESIGIGIDVSDRHREELRQELFEFLLLQIPDSAVRDSLRTKFLVSPTRNDQTVELSMCAPPEGMFGTYPFFIPRGVEQSQDALQYTLEAPTTSRNVVKVLRAMQLHKPLLLEGSPGVGKTSLIQAIAKASGNRVVRINLSEQTDMMDLLGTDLPLEGSEGGKFEWSDGIFLQALKNGDWVLLDELNLASQSVLEGLNSVLDHRAEIFIPELNRTFHCPRTFRIIACQNPLQQGGGRKGLPKSFLNRFTQIYVEELDPTDLLFIANAMYAEIGLDNLRKMIEFNRRMHVATMIECKFGRKGSPWEFNLRDVFRWCELLQSDLKRSTCAVISPGRYVDHIYRQRMRTEDDRQHVVQLFEEIFEETYNHDDFPHYTITPHALQIGQSYLPRRQLRSSSDAITNDAGHSILLHKSLNPLESIMKCIEMNYMCILTGPTASGKTSLVKFVAQMTGNRLHEFAMSSSTDTIELLGGFEQVDMTQRHKKLIEQIRSAFDELVTTAMTASDDEVEKEILQRIIQFYNEWSISVSRVDISGKDGWSSSDMTPSINELKSIIQRLQALRNVIVSPSDAAIISSKSCENLLSQAKKIEQLMLQGVKGRFEWNDGILIKAMEHGDWVLIDNVNFCNATVLDRLNSVLEPGGVLVVNERGLVDGEVKIVTPHPNFRLFMAMDPKYGEISRAMRNRGVEIALSPFEIPSQDVASILAFSTGIPSVEICDALMLFHSQFMQQIPMLSEDERPTIRDLIRCGNMLQMLCRAGDKSVLNALSSAVSSAYTTTRCHTEEQRRVAQQLIDSTLSSLQQLYSDKTIKTTSFPSVFNLITSFNADQSSSMTTLMREGAYVYYIVKKIMIHRFLNSGNQNSMEHVRALFNNRFSWEIIMTDIFGHSSFTEAESKEIVIEDGLDVCYRKLSFALGYFVQQSSTIDINMRIAWLEHLLERYNTLHQHLASSDAGLDRSRKSKNRGSKVSARSSDEVTHCILQSLFTLDQIRQSILCQVIEKQSLRNVQPVNTTIADLISHQPINRNLNKEFYALLTDVQILDSSDDALYEKFELFMERLPQQFLEKNHYKSMVQKSFIANQASLIHQSYWYSLHPEQRSRASNSIIPLLYVLFKAVDTTFQMLESPEETFGDIPVSMARDELTRIWNQRCNMWHFTNGTNELTEQFLVYWNTFHKSVQQSSVVRWLVQHDQCSDSPAQNAARHLVNVATEVETHIVDLFDSIGSKSYLWKHGGKPKVMQSDELSQMKHDVYALVPGKKTASVKNFQFKHLLVKVLSTIEWMNMNPQKLNTEDNGLMAELRANLMDLTQLMQKTTSSASPQAHHSANERINLEQRIEKMFDEVSRMNVISEYGSRDEGEVEAEHIVDKRVNQLRAHTVEVIDPLFDHKSMIEELELLSQLSEYIWNVRAHRDNNDDRREKDDTIHRSMIKRSKDLIELVLSKCGRTATDIVPIQTLVWVLSSLSDDDKSSDLKSVITSETLPAIMQDMWLNWHTRVWNNSFNSISSATVLTPFSRGEVSDAKLFELLIGPNKLFTDLKAVRVIQLLSNWKHVPIRARFAKIDQLRQLTDVISQKRFATSISYTSHMDWRHAFFTFAGTLACFGKSFPEQHHFQRLLSLLEDLRQLIEGTERTSEEQLEHLLESLRIIILNSSDQRLSNLVDTIISIGRLLYQQQKQVTVDADEPVSMVVQGRIWCLLGFIRMMLVMPAQPLDPTYKYGVKLSQLAADSEHTREKMLMYKVIERFIRGTEHSDTIADLAHQLTIIEEQSRQVERKVITRPSDVSIQFRELYRDLRQFVDSLSGKEKLFSMVDMFVKHADGSTTETSEVAMTKEDLWQHNAGHFIQKLLTKYRGYEDIIVPFANCVYQIRFGMRLLCYGSIAAHMHLSSNSFFLIKHAIRSMLEFPSTNSLKKLADLMKNAARMVELQMAKRGEHQNRFDNYDIIIKLLVVVTTRIRLHVGHSQSASSNELLQVFDVAFSLFVKMWHDVKLQYERLKEEESALVKYKEKTLTVDTDEDMLQKEIDDMFPLFTEEYAEFATESTPSHADTSTKKEEHQLQSKKLEKLYLLFQSSDVVKDMLSTHTRIVTLLAKGRQVTSFNHSVTDEDVAEVRHRMFDEAFDTVTSLVGREQQFDNHDYTLPVTLHASLALEQLTQRLSHERSLVVVHDENDADDNRRTSSYNAYSDENIPEVSICFGVVSELVARIRQLLDTYEGHPSLVHIVKIAEHVLNQPITAPVMKVLTGIELLMRRAHEWEEYITSPAGSIKDQISKLTSLVLRWRKLELDNWRSIAAIKSNKYVAATNQWWMQFYRLLCMSSFDTMSMKEQFKELGDQKNEDSTLLERVEDMFFAICDDLMRGSTIGEFRARLNLLSVFHTQMQVERRIPGFTRNNMTDELYMSFSNILFNIHRFYSQFLPKLETLVASESKPLEAKLKDFVKLQKWNDVNVDSVKNATSKSRRRLGKFSRGFEAIMTRRARDLWDNDQPQVSKDMVNGDSRSSKRKGNKKRASVMSRLESTLRTLLHSSETHHEQSDTLVLDVFSVEQFGTSEDSCVRFEKLHKTSKVMGRVIDKHIVHGETMKDCDVTVSYLEELCAAVIDRVQDLQEKDVMKTLKKRALVDLLSELKDIGIDHHSMSIEKFLRSKVLFQQSMLQWWEDNDDNHGDSALKNEMRVLFDSADNYYFKNTYMLQRVRIAASGEISKDINQSEVTRMKGFTENLHHLATKQRTHIATLFEQHKHLSQLSKILTSMHQDTPLQASTDSPLTQEFVHTWLQKAKTFLDGATELLEQMLLLYTSLSKTTPTSNRTVFSSQKDVLSQAHRLLVDAKKNIDTIHGRSLRVAPSFFVSTQRDIETITSTWRDIIPSAMNRMHEFIAVTTLPKSAEMSNLVAQGEKLYQHFLDSESQQHVDVRGRANPTFLKEFQDSYDNVVKHMQLSIQHLKHHGDSVKEQYSQLAMETDETVKDGTQDLGDSQEDDHTLAFDGTKHNCVARVHRHLINALPNQLKRVCETLQQLLSMVREGLGVSVTDPSVVHLCSRLLGGLTPLLSTLIRLVQMVKYSAIQFHKSLAKLQYVLANTFALLMKEGFCGKEGEEGESGEGDGTGQGGMQFHEGTGMDDGEGMDDVSKEIENQDQVLNQKDMQPQDPSRDKSKNIEENEDGIEIEDDFESEMFDKEKNQGEDDEESDEDEDDDLDKDMGEIDDDDPNKQTLDKRLWDDQEEEDGDDDREEEVDESNRNDSNDTPQQRESEMVGKEDEDENEDADDQKQQPRDSRDRPNPRQLEEEIEDEMNDGDEDEEHVEQQEFVDVIDDTNQDEEEDMGDEGEQQHDKHELPEELNLDMHDEEEDEVEDSGENDADDDADDPQGGVEAPQKQQEVQEDDAIQTEDIEQKEDAATQQDEESEEKEEGQEDEQSDTAADIDPILNESKMDEEGEEGEKELDDEEEEESEDDNKRNVNREEAFEDDLKETPYGVKQTAGSSSEINDLDKDKDDESEEKEMNQGEEFGKDVNKNEHGESFEQGDQEKSQESESASEQQFDPNPFRNLGDALKKWKEKIRMVENEERKQQDLQKQSEEEEETVDREADAYEFKKQDEQDAMDDDQVLANATEEQSEAFPQLDMDDNDDDDDDDEALQEQQDKMKDIQSDQKEDGEEEEDESESRNKAKSKNIALRFDKSNDSESDDDDDDDEDIEMDLDDATVEEVDGSKAVDASDETGKNMESTIHVRDVDELDDDNVEMSSEESTRLEQQKELTMDEIRQMRDELEVMLSQWRSSQDNVDRGNELWRRYDTLTQGLSHELCEQLRLILEPTLATKLKGDYKTGKRINMKKVIPYIASQFRKDKIWLRRTKPNKRQYQVMVAIDDSMSMSENGAGNMACEAMALICKAMTQLEVGQLSVASFGETMRLLHPFDKPFTDEAGAEIVAQFTFDQKQTQMAQFMEEAISVMDGYRSMELASGTEHLQLSFVISDGRMLEREEIVRLVRQAYEKRQLFVFILIDNPNPKESVLEIKSISYPNNKLTITSYMEQFPFPYYIILRDITSLPEILADVLRQWFEITSFSGM